MVLLPPQKVHPAKSGLTGTVSSGRSLLPGVGSGEAGAALRT